MLLVPRQLKRHGMTGAVPYYGGRLTPAHVYGIQQRPDAPRRPPPLQPRPAATRARPARPAGPAAQPEDAPGRARLPDLPARHRRDHPARVRRPPLAGRRVMGPVQVLVVGFEHPDFSGEVLAEFDRLRDAGVVRLVDLLVVTRTADGTFESLPLPDGFPADLGPGGRRAAGPGPGPGQRTPPGRRPRRRAGWLVTRRPCRPARRRAVALIEHLWAAPLTAALERAGGRPLEETWLGPDDRGALEALLQWRGEPARSGP